MAELFTSMVVVIVGLVIIGLVIIRHANNACIVNNPSELRPS